MFEIHRPTRLIEVQCQVSVPGTRGNVRSNLGDVRLIDGINRVISCINLLIIGITQFVKCINRLLVVYSYNFRFTNARSMVGVCPLVRSCLGLARKTLCLTRIPGCLVD